MKECTLILYSVFNDGNSTSTTLDEVIEIEGAALNPGSPLPQWKFGSDAPVVEYYDGESLDLSYDGKSFNVILGWDQVEIFSARCPENINVEESREVDIRLEKIYVMDTHPSWREMFAHGSYNAIVMNALPIAGKDRDAARYFLRTLTVASNLFLLSPQAIGLIEEYAGRNDKFALFALGRYHLCTMVDEDSLEKAKEYISKAHVLGLPEATAALAQMYFYGDFGMMDRTKARAFLAKAFDRNCDYAAEIHLRNIIFGLNGYEADQEKALGFIEDLIAGDIGRLGEGEENPLWYYLRGCSECRSKGYPAALDSFQKAADMGVVMAWSDIAIACSHNAEDELVDRNAFIKAIEYGKSKRDVMCCYLYAISRVDEYDSLPELEKMLEKERLIVNLEYAFSMGSSFAAETLGDIYYYGSYDIDEDDSKAWQWYAQGALLNNVDCYEKMFDMVRNHYIEKDEEFKDMLALRGARLESKKLIGETVIAYTYGRLTEFAAEIEQYYEPVFDGPEDDEFQDEDRLSDDEPQDDDGRFDAYV